MYTINLKHIVFTIISSFLPCSLQSLSSPACIHAKSLRLCPTLWDLMDCSPPGSSVHGILQERILEWVAMPSIFWIQGSNLHLLCLLHWQVGSLPLALPGKPLGIPLGSPLPRIKPGPQTTREFKRVLFRFSCLKLSIEQTEAARSEAQVLYKVWGCKLQSGELQVAFRNKVHSLAVALGFERYYFSQSGVYVHKFFFHMSHL